MKLGKLPPKKDERNLKFSHYVHDESAHKIPDECNWGHKIEKDKWGTMRNLKIDDCTCAAAGHMIMAWTSNIGRMIRPTDRDIVKAYANVSNYNPKTGKGDDGAYCIDVLKYWRKKGIADRTILAFAELEEKKHNQIKQAIYLFGGCYIGIGMPLSAKKQRVWNVPIGGARGDGKKGSWGGHTVMVTGYNDEGLRVITWGKEKMMTWDFWNAYCEESYAVFSEDFIKDDKTPIGIDIKTLKKDLALLKAGDEIK